MTQDFPHANARLAEVARHWADGEVSHETWRRERRNILRELCARHADCQERPSLITGTAVPRPAPEMPVVAAAAAAMPAATPPVATEDVDGDVVHEEVLTLALVLIAVVVGAILIFFLA